VQTVGGVMVSTRLQWS